MIKRFLLAGVIVMLLAATPILSEEMPDSGQPGIEQQIGARTPEPNRVDPDKPAVEEDRQNSDQSAQEDYSYFLEDLEDISKRLDRVETESILHKIKFSGEFRTKLEYFRYKNALSFDETQSAIREFDGETEELWSHRLRLNMRSEVTDNIIFHGRLSYFKLWGESDYTQFVSDYEMASVPDKTGHLHVERAYVDYFLQGTPVSLTFGRLPAGEGPPKELRDLTTRKGTWPIMMNDAEVDGIIATVTLDGWTGLNKSFFRSAYAKLYQNFVGYEDDDIQDSRVWVFAFETEIPSIKDSILWIGYAALNNSTPSLSSGDFISMPDDLGSMRFGNVLIEIQNISNSGLDAFLAATCLLLDPSKEGIRFENGYEIGMMCDNLHGNLGQNRQATAVYTGLRYQLPVESLKNPYVGAEYVYGSKYWTGLFSSGGGDLVNKLDVSGNAFELYYIQPVHQNRMFCRIGTIYMDHDYVTPLVIYGTKMKSDQTLAYHYFLVDVRF